MLKMYTQIWKRFRNLLNINFDSEAVYGDNEKYIKAKIKIYEDKGNTNFQGKKLSKENTTYKCLSLVMLDFAVRKRRKYYPQTHLEEWKYEKKTITENLINDELEPSLSDESEKECNNESDNEPKKAF